MGLLHFLVANKEKNSICSLKDHVVDQPVGVPVGVAKMVEGATDIPACDG